MENKFTDIAVKYFMKFKTYPPRLSTLSKEDPLYLKELEKAIERNNPIDRDYLADIFMPDKKAFY